MILSKTSNNNWIPTASGNGTFIGTLAAFNAIKDTLPNNTVAYITDDGNGDLQPVDAVTNGDMHPVTSNAVYDSLNNVTNVAMTKTSNVVAEYSCGCFRLGKLVLVTLNLLVSDTPSGKVLYTGLPKPTRRLALTCNGYYRTNLAIRCSLEQNGDLLVDNDTTDWYGQNFGGLCFYFTD